MWLEICDKGTDQHTFILCQRHTELIDHSIEFYVVQTALNTTSGLLGGPDKWIGADHFNPSYSILLFKEND